MYTNHIQKITRATTIATNTIKHLHRSSLDTAMKLFQMKVTSIKTYGLDIIWESSSSECSVQGQVLHCKCRNQVCSSAKDRSSTAVLPGMNRCVSFPFLSAFYYCIYLTIQFYILCVLLTEKYSWNSYFFGNVISALHFLVRLNETTIPHCSSVKYLEYT